jgi:hypothetical protein
MIPFVMDNVHHTGEAWERPQTDSQNTLFNRVEYNGGGLSKRWERAP